MGRVLFGLCTCLAFRFFEKNIAHPPLLKDHTGHGLIDKLIIVVFAVSHQAGVASQCRHFLQIVGHIAMAAEQLVAEQAVYRENGRARGKILAYPADSVLDDGPVIAQLQQNQHVGVVDLPETGQRITLYVFDGDDTGVVPVDLAEGVLEGTGEDLLVCYMQDFLVDLFGRFPVQGPQDILGTVCLGSDETVICLLYTSDAADEEAWFRTSP